MKNIIESKVGSQLKKLVYITGIASIGLFATSCTAGFVVTEPVYVEDPRPPQPSNLHIWIDGDWIWSRQSHVYIRERGHWSSPRHGRSYQSGYWQSTPKGQHWAPGRWERHDNKGGNRRR